MTKDNKLEQKAYNKYYELKDYLGRLQDEYQTRHIRYMNESDTRQRAMARKDLDEISLRIRRTQQEMNKIKNSIHLKDSMDMLKLSGFTVDEEVSPKFKKVMEEYGKGELKSSSGEKVTDPKQAKAIAYSEAGESKDGGPGSGIKGHTTESSEESFWENKLREVAKQKGISESDIESLISQIKKGGAKAVMSPKDSCGEKVFTKGTDDDDATKEGAIKEYGAKEGSFEDACTKDTSVVWVKPSSINYKIGDIIQYKGNQVRVTKVNGNVVEAEVMGKAEDACSNKDSAIQKECNEILRLSGFIS